MAPCTISTEQDTLPPPPTALPGLPPRLSLGTPRGAGALCSALQKSPWEKTYGKIAADRFDRRGNDSFSPTGIWLQRLPRHHRGTSQRQYPGIVAVRGQELNTGVTQARPGHPGVPITLQNAGTGKRFRWEELPRWRTIGQSHDSGCNYGHTTSTVTRSAVKSPSTSTVPWMLVISPTITSAKAMGRRPSGVHL